jgi:hypothetical protein
VIEALDGGEAPVGERFVDEPPKHADVLFLSALKNAKRHLYLSFFWHANELI